MEVINEIQELAERHQWVCWRYKTTNGKQTKIPMCPDGKPARTNDPATWAWHAEVVKASCRFNGIGYVFADDDPYTGIDFDACLHPNGSVAAWAEPWLAKFKSYAEVSPSLTGIKVFIRGSLPKRCKHKIIIDGAELIDGKEPAIEVYDSKRFFTVTGRVWNEQTIILDQQQELDIMLASCGFVEPEKTKAQDIKQEQRSASTQGRTDWTESDYATWYLSRVAAWRADDYNMWLAVGKCLACLPDGLSLWRTWSLQSTKYREGDCDRRWATIGSDTNGIAKLGAWANEDNPLIRNNGNIRTMTTTTGQHAYNNEATCTNSHPTCTQHEQDMHKVISALEPYIQPTCTTCTTFPIDMFSDVWRDMIIETAHAVECDQGLAGATLLAMISTVLQGKVAIRRNHTRTHPVNLYIAIGSPTGAGKTPIFGYFMRAIETIEKDLITKWQADVRLYTDLPDGERARAEHPLEDEPCLYTSDTTSESLHGMLVSNGGCGGDPE